MADTAKADLTQPTTFRLALYDALRRTAEQQRAALQRDDLGDFQALLEERERILAKVEQVGRLTEATESVSNERETAAAILREIMALDAETTGLLNHLISQARREAATVSGNRAAMRGYGNLRVVGLPLVNQTG